MAIANAPLGYRKKLLGVLVETTAGTLNDPSSAVSMVVTNATMKPDGIFPTIRQPYGNYHGTTDRVREVLKGVCEFEWKVSSADALMVLLQGCGFTVNTGATAATPTSSIAAMSTLSMKLWEDGREKTMIGCAGTLEFTGSNGAELTCRGTFNGVWVDTTDEAMPSQAPINTAGYVARAVTLTIGAAAIPLVSEFTVNIGATVEPRESLVQDAAILHYIATDRNPTINLDPEARLVAGHDSYGLLVAGTTGALVLAMDDPAGNTITFNAARVQRIEVDDANRTGKLTDPITLECHNSSGNDDLTITKS